MNFSSVKSDYALRALFDLACHGSSDPVKIAEIAKRQGIPPKFLELILGNLKQGGFVESRRGADGGYRLARPASGITIGEVLRYIEGKNPRTRTPGGSPVAELWKKLDEAAAQILNATTLESLAMEWAEKQRRFVPNWEI